MDLLIYGTLYDFDNIKTKFAISKQYFMYYLYFSMKSNDVLSSLNFLNKFYEAKNSKSCTPDNGST